MPAMPTACQPDTTSSVLQGSYLWPMTNLSTVASLECEYGAVLSTDNMGSGDTESMALVTRECMSDGMWGEPDYSNCGECKYDRNTIYILYKICNCMHA